MNIFFFKNNCPPRSSFYFIPRGKMGGGILIEPSRPWPTLTSTPAPSQTIRCSDISNLKYFKKTCTCLIHDNYRLNGIIYFKGGYRIVYPSTRSDYMYIWKKTHFHSYLYHIPYFLILLTAGQHVSGWPIIHVLLCALIYAPCKVSCDMHFRDIYTYNRSQLFSLHVPNIVWIYHGRIIIHVFTCI